MIGVENDDKLVLEVENVQVVSVKQVGNVVKTVHSNLVYKDKHFDNSSIKVRALIQDELVPIDKNMV